jgi:hypothetical protein
VAVRLPKCCAPTESEGGRIRRLDSDAPGGRAISSGFRRPHHEFKRGLLDSKLVLLNAHVDVVRADAYSTSTAVTTKLICHGGEHETRALPEAKAGSPGLGVSIAKAVGFGLLGLGGGIAREVGLENLEDRRMQRNIREGIRGALTKRTAT